MKLLCLPCMDASGEKSNAVKIVAQESDIEGCVQYVPVCEAHLDGWFEDCDEALTKLPQFDVPRST